jgi:hypothetical protein
VLIVEIGLPPIARSEPGKALNTPAAAAVLQNCLRVGSELLVSVISLSA